jgi:hypothetical protein
MPEEKTEGSVRRWERWLLDAALPPGLLIAVAVLGNWTWVISRRGGTVDFLLSVLASVLVGVVLFLLGYMVGAVPTDRR